MCGPPPPLALRVPWPPPRIYYTKKYNDVPTSAFDAENDWIILRYADVLLMYAEAVNETSGPNALALDAVNRVIRRSRNLPVATAAPAVDLPATISQADLRTRLELERRLELNLEGHRWFDLVRTDRALPVMNAFFMRAPSAQAHHRQQPGVPAADSGNPNQPDSDPEPGLQLECRCEKSRHAERSEASAAASAIAAVQLLHRSHTSFLHHPFPPFTCPHPTR